MKPFRSKAKLASAMSWVRPRPAVIPPEASPALGAVSNDVPGPADGGGPGEVESSTDRGAFTSYSLIGW